MPFKPRKELLEAWVMALYVHQHFPHKTNIIALPIWPAVMASYLSWAWLLLGNDGNDQNNNNRSAVCIDIRMPGSAEKVANATLQEWPQFKECWEYVEGSVDVIVPDSLVHFVSGSPCMHVAGYVIRQSDDSFGDTRAYIRLSRSKLVALARRTTETQMTRQSYDYGNIL
jgi:hypothetical protein